MPKAKAVPGAGGQVWQVPGAGVRGCKRARKQSKVGNQVKGYGKAKSNFKYFRYLLVEIFTSF